MTESPKTIPEALFVTATKYGHARALVDGAQSYSYCELVEVALRASVALGQMGIRHGDRVAIWLPNSATWIVAALGALGLGAIIVPINTRLKPKEAEYILKKSAARVLLTTSDFLGTDYVQAAKALDLPALAHVTDARIDGGDCAWQEACALATADQIEEARTMALAVRPSDVAEVIFTSGTTGFPKGAMLSHGQITGAYEIYGDRAGIGPDGRYLVVAPMFHSFGWKAGVIVSLLKGATVYPMAVFNAQEALDTIESEKITIMGGPPTIFTSLLELSGDAGHDMSSLESIVLGGSMISPDLVRTLRTDMGVGIVLSAYGLTETTALVTMAHRDDDAELIATTAGQVFPNMEMRCVDDRGQVVPVGKPGEIQTRGANVMAGYFEDSERTVDSFTQDGWFRTGDVGVIDANGYLAITDRIKDMIITGGFNCYPAEVEAIIGTHPDVKEVAIIGIPDARMGEVAKAFIVPRPGKAIENDAFFTWCRAQMANFKVPRQIETLDALPRNAMGKVQKFLLREIT